MLRSLRPLAAATLTLLLFSAQAQNENVGINTTGAAPNASAMLDVDVTALGAKRGMLIPRMTEVERTSIPTPATGLWVFQTNDGLGRHGFWYYTGTVWMRMSDGPGWRLPGNDLTTAGTHYLGTPDAQPLVIRTNGVERMRFLPSGAGMAPIGINTAAPTEALHVDGAVRIFQTPVSANNTQGAIRYTATAPAGQRAHQGNTNGTAAGWGRLENAERRVLNDDYTGSTIQCAPGTAISSPNSGPGTGSFDSPFPTDQARGWKVQYIFTQAQLLAFGLCAGNITELTLFSTEDDLLPNPPTNPSGAAMDYEVKLETTALAAFGNWANLSASPVRFSASGAIIGSGQITWPLSPAYNWNGATNIILEVTYLRAANAGIGPNFQHTAAVGFACTKYGYVAGATPHGNTFTDAPLNPVTLLTGTNNNRPIVRFTGQANTPVPILAFANYTQYNGGLMVGTAAFASGSTAGQPNFKGPGTIHADTAVFDGNTQLSDHVFDRYYDGQVRPEDAPAAATYNYVELRHLKSYLAENRHLPSMPSREQWETRGTPSLGTMATKLWETVETQALYIVELERDLRVLEELAYREQLSETELEELVAQVHKSPRLSAEQKAHVAAAIRERFQQIR
ncbi:MAG: hypothetical protein JNM31_10710 [Flavobacteriales bacterium]|nr:hypothetical protein [Flavobacteriales bacterium]